MTEHTTKAGKPDHWLVYFASDAAEPGVKGAAAVS